MNVRKSDHASYLSHLDRIHFSWYFLCAALIGSLLSLIAFSVSTVTLLNNAQVVDTQFPGLLSEWKVSGDVRSFQVCESAICFQSASNTRSIMVRELAIAPQDLAGADLFLLEADVSEWSGVDPYNFKGAESVLTVRSRASDGTILRHLRPIVHFQQYQESRRYKGISAIDPDTVSLRLAIVVRSTVVGKVDDVRIQIIKLKNGFKILRWVVFTGWFLLLIGLAIRVHAHLSSRMKVVTTLLFSGLLVAGSGQLASGLPGSLATRMAALPFTEPGYAAFSSTTLNPLLHIGFHLAFTLYLIVFTKPLQLTAARIVVLNLSTAMGIECVQMGIPERSAELSDVGFAMIGMLVVLVPVLIKQLRSNNASRANPNP